MVLPPASNEAMQIIFGSILSGFLDAFKFAPDIRSMRKTMIYATIEVYKQISETMLPTPAKSHYTFNLRDVSKVFQGILMVRPAMSR